MKKKVLKLSGIITVLFIVTTGFKSWTNAITSYEVIYNLPSVNYHATVSQEILEPAPYTPIMTPLTGNSFIGFKEALGFKESQGKYHVINTLGYLGKYQFGKSTLKRFNIYNTSEFLKDSKLQEDAFLALCSVNKWILIRDIKRFVGKRINGTIITESGILAAAHLAGAGNVKRYLRSYGSEQFEDAYGTSIKYYLKKFAGFDTSMVEANKTPEL